MDRPSIQTAESFWKKVNIQGPDDCWEWARGRTSSGYGRVRWHLDQFVAHRIAYKLTYGEFDETKFVCHHCDNPLCCNPKHLFLGTNKDNVNDSIAKGRFKGYTTMRGEENGRAILNAEKVKQIRQLYATKQHSQLDLALEFDVCETSIYNIVHNKTWRDIHG